MPDFDNLSMPLDGDETSVTLDDETRDQTVTDDGHTSGGGSLGHDQPDKVKRETPIRNATGSTSDPVMPQDDATLNTRI
jgi:hypothetical protein